MGDAASLDDGAALDVPHDGSGCVMTDNVVPFTGITKLDLPADHVIEQARGKLKSVVIVGELEDGSEYFASSVAGGPDVLWALERAKLRLLQIVDA